MRSAVLGDPTDPPRVAFAVGRSVGGSVERNRVRRQLRAAVSEHASLLQPGRGYLVRAHAATKLLPYPALSDTLRALLADDLQVTR